MDAASGAVLWNSRIPSTYSAENGRVLETNGVVLVVLMRMAGERYGTAAYALDAASGRLLWDSGRALVEGRVADGMG